MWNLSIGLVSFNNSVIKGVNYKFLVELLVKRVELISLKYA